MKEEKDGGQGRKMLGRGWLKCLDGGLSKFLIAMLMKLMIVADHSNSTGKVAVVHHNSNGEVIVRCIDGNQRRGDDVRRQGEDG